MPTDISVNPDLNNLSGTMTDQNTDASSSGLLTNLRVAMRSALTEAGQKKASDRITALSPMLEGGAAPNVITAAIGLAQSGLKDTKESMISDIVTGYTQEEQMKQTKKATALSTINSMIDNGVYTDTPDEALLSLEQSAGLTAGTALAWKARLKVAQKQDDEVKNLQITKLKQDISDAQAAAGKTGGNVIDILQDGINNGRTPEQAARDAATVMENQGIPVSMDVINKWTETAKSLTKVAQTPAAPAIVVPPTNPTAAEVGKKVKGGLGYVATLGGHPEIIGGSLVKGTEAVGSFFQGLFGK